MSTKDFALEVKEKTKKEVFAILNQKLRELRMLLFTGSKNATEVKKFKSQIAFLKNYIRDKNYF
jgi:ribosomal protein L29